MGGLGDSTWLCITYACTTTANNLGSSASPPVAKRQALAPPFPTECAKKSKTIICFNWIDFITKEGVEQQKKKGVSG